MITKRISPATTPQRHLQIDAFRAFALFGLFMVHCVELFELHWADPKASIWFDATFLLFAGKAFAMFALSFGLSFSIIISRAKQRNEAYQATFLWRSVILILLGLAHTIIYRGDILIILGLVGMLLVPFNKLKSNMVLFVLAILLLINVPLIIRLMLTYYGVGTGIPIMVEANSASMQAYLNGGLFESLSANLSYGNLVKWLYMLESGRVTQILGLFLLGLILGRKHAFIDLPEFKLSRRITILVSACLGFLLYKNQTFIISIFPPSTIGETQFYISNLVKGWINLLFMFFQTAVFFELWFVLQGRLIKFLAPAGRMSLTLYIGQSIIFVPLLYNMGLGLYDDVTAQQMFWVGIVGFIVQAVFATIWFRHFYYGPLEWLWRVFTKRSWEVPFRRVDSLIS